MELATERARGVGKGSVETTSAPHRLHRARGLLPPARAAAVAAVTTVWLGHVETMLRLTPEAEQEAFYQRHLARWAGVQLRLLGIEVRIEGTPPPPLGPRLVVSSHRSAMDILIALSLFGGCILSHGDVARWPVLGRLAKRTRTIFVDRKNSASGAGAIRQIRRELQTGRTVTVFPEGTTYRGDEVRPFKAGVFVATSRLDVEVVPMGVAYPPGVEFWREPFGSYLTRVTRRTRTPVGVVVGTPRRSTSAKTAVLASTLQEDVQALTHRARALL